MADFDKPEILRCAQDDKVRRDDKVRGDDKVCRKERCDDRL